MLDDRISPLSASKAMSTTEPLPVRMCAALIALGSAGSYALAYAIVVGLSRFIQSF